MTKKTVDKTEKRTNRLESLLYEMIGVNLVLFTGIFACAVFDSHLQKFPVGLIFTTLVLMTLYLNAKALIKAMQI